MHRWLIMAALPLVMGAAALAWADDVADCANMETMLKAAPATVVSACRRLAEQDNAHAEDQLGRMYYEGLGVPQDYTEAAKWWHKAADQGNAVAQYNLAVMHYFGQAMPQDYAMAAKLYLEAAEQGDAYAEYDLGRMYRNGRGVPQDYVQAYMWWNLAAAQGDTEAAKQRDMIAARMTPSQISQGRALAAARKPTTGQ